MTSVTTTWEPGRRFMLRVAGLPVESVHALRCTESLHWAKEVLDAEDRLRVRAAELSDVLHDLVTTTDTAVRGSGDASRRQLLALRRQMFNNRLPADPAAAMELISGLDAEAGRQVADWLARRQQLEELHTAGEQLLASDLERSRAALRELMKEERLRLGLLLASPTLDGQLEGYLSKAAAGVRPDKRMRKVERSLLSYLYRTACKTSPFSTFTGVATGLFTDGGDEPHGERNGSDAAAIQVDAGWESRARLNVVVLGRLAELILADPARRSDLPVRLASGWGRDEDRVRYVRRWVTAGDDAATVTFDSVKDRLFFLRRSGILDQLLALFDERPELRYRELADWIGAEHDAPPEQCETYLSALLQLGMIRVPCLDTDVHSPDPLRSFQTALRGLGRPWAEQIADGLEGPLAKIAAFPAADVRRRASLLRELREELHGLQRQLGAQEPSLPQTILYEDVSAGTDVACPWQDWNGRVGEDLRALESVLPAFDVTLPQRITFKGFFLARHGRGGRCEDLLGLVHDFHEDFFDQYLSFTAKRRAFNDQGEYVPEENWLNIPGIKAVDSARRVFVDRMRKLWAERDGDAEIQLGREHFEEVAAEIAPVSPVFAPQSHHLQLARENGDPLVVVNRSYGGVSFPFSRFTHVYDGPEGGEALSGALRERARAQTPPGAVLAEVTGGSVTSNLNLHGRLTDYEIVCPGETSTVPEEARIHLEDLYVEHDEEADRLVLRSSRLDCEVVPVYLGYLVPLALPEISRTLLLLSPTSMARLDVWGGVPEPEADEGVTVRPRVRHGGLVLSRRSWSTTAASLPARQQPGVEEHTWFLGWQRWRRRHGLPARVFATVASGPRGAAGAKPSCVDLDSSLSLTAFEALLKGDEDQVVLREMLPTEDGLHVRSERGSHVAELAVETFTTPGPAAPDASSLPTRPAKDAPR
ncbi:lantibiotic dehydratase [Streptomyces albidus (ex Kaewkla and Franco 2022)]|uniref:lantibiotic dehydratase n=1 Tax=Streptomyces albidus (ex Kaewkla and Franco 2022) TaxID=722709 RepID=UPI001F1C17A5|nr:lantibiotic dehydratase [Streptomyces albidus (ex Kaewkla and Franco 2022)]